MTGVLTGKRATHLGLLAFVLGLLAVFLSATFSCAQAAPSSAAVSASAPCHDKMPMAPACAADCPLLCLAIMPSGTTLSEPVERYAPLTAPPSADRLEGLTIPPPRPPPR